MESKLDGFGRLIYNTGAYYIGFFKQGKFHGYGYFHFETGGCKEGLWKDHKLLNKLTDPAFDQTPEIAKKFDAAKCFIKMDGEGDNKKEQGGDQAKKEEGK